MRTQRFVIVALVICLFSILTTDAFAFYNPQTGHWLSRDPIGERGGANLYGFVRNVPPAHFDILGLSDPDAKKVCACCIAKLLKDGKDDEVRTKLAANINFVSSGDDSKKQIFDDLIHIGKDGGKLGLALIARTTCGDKLNINAVNDSSNKRSNAGVGVDGILSLNTAFLNYEYLAPPEQTFLGGYIDSGAITIAHELGHAYLNLQDPFNVYLVENEIRKAFGRPLRPHYDSDREDDPRKRGDESGLIWDNPLSFPRSVPKEVWINKYIEGQKTRNKFIDQWSCQ